MKNTKEIILNTALDLFNSDGLSKVTLRTIANKIGISQGNLNYHFKKREDIITTLYFQLVEKMDDCMLSVQNTNNLLKVLFETSKIAIQNFYTYRFIMLDFVQIMRENSMIKKHYLELLALREQQFTMLIHLLIENDLVRKELLPNEYKNLYSRFQIISDFWISSAEIMNQPLSKKSILKYTEIINQTVFPYLTEKGRKEYQLMVLE